MQFTYELAGLTCSDGSATRTSSLLLKRRKIGKLYYSIKDLENHEIKAGNCSLLLRKCNTWVNVTTKDFFDQVENSSPGIALLF